jgi:hypothetical protein
MQTPNRDMFVTESTQRQFKTVAPLIVAPEIDQEFLKRNKAANTAKRRYHRFGQLAIVLVAMSAIFTIAEALILPEFLNNIALKFAAVGMAGTGITLQCILILTKQKQKWLINRFAAERLRSLKFQAFILAQTAQDTKDLQNLVQSFSQKELARLENELNTGIAVLRNFSPVKALTDIAAPAKPKNADLASLAREAYTELRVQYQKNFALSEVTNFSGRRRWFNSTQDMIYLAAAAFTFLSIGIKLAGPNVIGIDTGWIDFLAVTLFVLGATEAIMDNALLEEQSQTRFEQYVRDIEEIANGPKLGETNLSRLVLDMERICLNELDVFCRAADRISYRF